MTEPVNALSKTAERPPEVAVAPLNTIDQQDIGAGAAAFDKWLRKVSQDHVTLERVSILAGSLPIIGNIMAVIDAVMDMVGMVQKTIKGEEIAFLEWVNLGVNLIGVVPVPPTMSAARMSLRPALHLARQKRADGSPHNSSFYAIEKQTLHKIGWKVYKGAPTAIKQASITSKPSARPKSKVLCPL